LVTKWETLAINQIADLKIFTANVVERLNPLTKQCGVFTVLDSPNWVNIIPVTEDGNIVFVKQYRHGTDSITIEIPGGLSEKYETATEAAKRECIEETGYIGEGEPILIGESYPNPAYQNNKCSTFVWFGCKKVNGQTLDKHEIIDIIEFSKNDVKQMILNNQINHSVILTALFYFQLKYTL
jgi:8-oxo-dGTP pyrophosphatase MutT (NUDIX family)